MTLKAGAESVGKMWKTVKLSWSLSIYACPQLHYELELGSDLFTVYFHHLMAFA